MTTWFERASEGKYDLMIGCCGGGSQSRREGGVGGGGGGGGEKEKELRGRISYVNSCGSQSANLEHQTSILDFAGFGGASVRSVER